MTQTPQPPPGVDLPPGTRVQLNGYEPVGTIVTGDDWWDSLQLRGVAADQQRLVEWSGDTTVRTWERKAHLKIAVEPAPAVKPQALPAKKKPSAGGQQ